MDWITSLIIIAVAILIVKLLNSMFLRWQKKLVSSEKSSEAVQSIKTRLAMTHKIINVLLYFFAFAFLLLQFDSVRSIGAGLLASAGIAGIIIGMAAQNTLSNIIAGISISFSQPVRLNDAVIFENDFGWIEKITLTHTIIRTWDNRRIVTPNNILVSRVIQNWTIIDTSLLGVVMMYVDYICDVNRVKKWVKEIVDASPYSTEERVAVVQVVDFTEKSMVLRILGKGVDAPNTRKLCCEIREKLIQKVKQEKMPLPIFRINSTGPEISSKVTTKE